MKLSEAKIRQVIREELETVLSEMNNEQHSEKPEMGFSGKEVAGMAAVGVAGNAAFAALQDFFHTHPDVLEAIRTGALSISQVINQMMMENKSRK